MKCRSPPALPRNPRRSNSRQSSFRFALSFSSVCLRSVTAPRLNNFYTPQHLQKRLHGDDFQTIQLSRALVEGDDDGPFWMMVFTKSTDTLQVMRLNLLHAFDL